MIIKSLESFQKATYSNGRVLSPSETAALPYLRRHDGSGLTSAQIGAIQMAGMFSFLWERRGRVTYQIDHSLAALLSVTKSQPIDWSKLPVESLVIDVPHDFCPAFPGTSDLGMISPTRVFICIGRIDPNKEDDTGTTHMFGIVSQTNLCTFGASSDGSQFFEDMRIGADPQTSHPGMVGDRAHGIKIAARLAANVIAFVTQHRECVRAPAIRRSGSSAKTFSVRPPVDVHVDREFRDLAKGLVGTRSFAGAKQALSHIVRGHWRNQHVGEDRKERRLTWVRPHRRGSESLGSVVSRVERLR